MEILCESKKNHSHDKKYDSSAYDFFMGEIPQIGLKALQTKLSTMGANSFANKRLYLDPSYIRSFHVSNRKK